MSICLHFVFDINFFCLLGILDYGCNIIILDLLLSLLLSSLLPRVLSFHLLIHTLPELPHIMEEDLTTSAISIYRVLLCLKRALRIANAAQQMANVTRGNSGPVTLFVEILNKSVV